MFVQILALLRKEILMEWRQKYALNGMLLYVGSTVFIAYLSFALRSSQLNPATWNALFWIILLFTSVNAVAKSFMMEPAGRIIYYYTLASPRAVILSKIIYNFLLMLLLSIIAFIFYSIVLGSPVEDLTVFYIALFLGALGFSASLTMISGIASKAGNNATLMAILGIPVLIPMLLLLIKLSKNAIDGLDRASSADEIILLAAINVMIATVSFILFPYLWKA